MRSRPRRERGFTLLELLVVLVILAVVAATAVFSIGTLGRDDRLQEEALRLTSLLRLAAEEALLSGRDIGLYMEEDKYRFLLYSRETVQWLILEGDDTFRPWNLPEEVYFSVAVEDREIVLEPAEDLETIEPQIAVYSSGDITPFEIYLNRELSDQKFLIEGLPNGNIEFQELDPDAL
ncbi:MAG: type II secretion system minor pseudopilin GspH [Gammaproteobacteria bacterium]